jgi:putative tryptophan/tyrosine transport system substrate-binding protein
MNRRWLGLLALLTLVTSFCPNPILAQQAPEIARVGILAPGLPPPPHLPSAVTASFRKALSELDYVEGKNLVLEERWQPSGKKEWLPDAIRELESANVQVIFAFGAIPARALKAANTTIPSVFIMVIPTTEFVSNPKQPEGRMTGFTIFDPKLPRQQLEILRQVLPTAKRVAYLGDEAVGAGPFRPHEEAARSLGLEPVVLKLHAPKPDLAEAFEEMKRQQTDALVVLPHPIIGVHRQSIGEYALKTRLPALFPAGGADAGGLLTYGTEFAVATKPAAVYVDRILKGAKPSDLPVETILQHELIVNLKTAQALSITVPPDVLKNAMRVVK